MQCPPPIRVLKPFVSGCIAGGYCLLRRVFLIVLIAGCLQGSALAAPVPVIVQLSPLTNVNIIAQLLGGNILDSIPGVNTHLLSLPGLPVLSNLQLSLLGIVSIEVDKSVPIGAT